MRFKILTIKKVNIKLLENCLVDPTLLSKGLYLTDRPPLYKENETIDSLIRKYELMTMIYGKDRDEIISNLRKCQLIKVDLIPTTNEK